MGQFSWITQNSDESIYIYEYIPECFIEACGAPTYYLWDDKMNVWEEKKYEGYGMFGGKDYYVLLAEMNNEYGSDVDEETKRKDGIDIEFCGSKTYIGKDGKIHDYKYPNLTSIHRWSWKNEQPERCFNQGCFILPEIDW